MIDQPVAQFLGNLLLQSFQFRIDKFDHATGFHIDQMIMVGFGNRFIARPAVAKIVTIQYACLFKKTNRPVDRCNRDAGVDRRGAFVQGLDIGMIFGIGNDARNDPTLVGDAEPFFRT